SSMAMGRIDNQSTDLPKAASEPFLAEDNVLGSPGSNLANDISSPLPEVGFNLVSTIELSPLTEYCTQNRSPLKENPQGFLTKWSSPVFPRPGSEGYGSTEDWLRRWPLVLFESVFVEPLREMQVIAAR